MQLKSISVKVNAMQTPTRKSPRDFVYVDELWEADARWPNYFSRNRIWVYFDEYRAELTGDKDYSRIIIHTAHDEGWIFIRPLNEKDLVKNTLKQVQRPVSQAQLAALGFTPWQGEYN